MFGLFSFYIAFKILKFLTPLQEFLDPPLYDCYKNLPRNIYNIVSNYLDFAQISGLFQLCI